MKKKETERKGRRVSIPPPTEIEVAPTGYQPSKAELEQEFTMPNLSEEEARRLFMRPIRLVGRAPRKS